MLQDSRRKLASGVGTAAAPVPPGLPASGTPPGAALGAGFGQRFGETERKDNWWLVPLSQAVGLALLGIYATWAAFQGNHFHFEEGGRDYLSPFYSPLIKPSWWPLSPALLILWAPLGFRATCYYYRKAYYRSFFADPVACAVGELKSKGYCGEVKFPFVLQNLHRYFLYIALAILVILWIDVVRAFIIAGRFAVGGGSLAILASTGLLTLYTFSCHSLRHIVGGQLDCFSCAVAGGPRQTAWSWVSFLNEHHMGWAWWSLFGVCFADLYVRLCSMGIIGDRMLYPFDLFWMPTPTGM